MNKHFIYLGVIAVLLILIGFNRCGSNEVKVETKTETVIDSTKVDSLKEEITYLKSLPPDTVREKVPIPTEPETVVTKPDGTKVKEYKSTYSDSVISASWTTGLTGSLRYQNFQYNLHHRPVTKQIVTKTETVYRTKKVETTITKQQGGYLAVGGDIGHSRLTNSVGSIQIRYQAKDGYSYHARYDPLLDAYYIGGTIPIRIKLPF